MTGTNTAVEAFGLGKHYELGVVDSCRKDTLRDALVRAARNGLARATAPRSRKARNSIWALRDASFTVRAGEAVGILGRNGAGKSTLLKILTRITSPTTGTAALRGRVGSLIEVGTGFHPDLTGRDNVFLNGAVLGMSRAYVRRRFDEIVAFAGVERFIDTPVKRYSSGMYLRLGFAVAAHLEPEVLVVDEVLAVGDAEFQRKCLGRMDDVTKDGRTVLFVSHNLGAIQRLCPRSLLLENGRIIADGKSSDVILDYLARGGGEARPATWIDLSESQREGSGASRVLALRYSSADPAVDFRPFPGGPLEIALRVRASAPVAQATVGFTVRDPYGAALLSGSTTASGTRSPLPAGESSWRVWIRELPLRPGRYQLELWLSDVLGIHDLLRPAVRLEVFDRETRPWGPRYDPRCDGPVYCEYEVEAVAEHDEIQLAAASPARDGRVEYEPGQTMHRVDEQLLR